MTVADLIAALQRHDPAAEALVADGLRYVPLDLVRIAGTEYGLEPHGKPKVAIIPLRHT